MMIDECDVMGKKLDYKKPELKIHGSFSEITAGDYSTVEGEPHKDFS